MKRSLLLSSVFLFVTVTYAQSNKSEALQHFEIAKEAFHQNYGTQEAWIQGMMKTEAELNKSLELDQSTADVFYYRALLFINAEDFERAIEFCEYAIQRDSTNAEYHLRKGVVHSNLQQFTAAMASLNQALIYAPDDGNVHFNRGMVYYFTDQTDNACESFKKALALGLSSAQEGVDRVCN